MPNPHFHIFDSGLYFSHRDYCREIQRLNSDCGLYAASHIDCCREIQKAVRWQSNGYFLPKRGRGRRAGCLCATVIPGLGESEAGGSGVQTSLSNCETSFQNERDRETKNKQNWERGNNIKGGDVFVCRTIPNMKPQSVWNLMHGLSLLNEVMRDSWRETELKKRKIGNIKDLQGEK